MIQWLPPLLLLLAWRLHLGACRNAPGTPLLAVKAKVEFGWKAGGGRASGSELNVGNTHAHKFLELTHQNQDARHATAPAPAHKRSRHSGKKDHGKDVKPPAKAPTSSSLHSPSTALPPSLPPGNAPSPLAPTPNVSFPPPSPSPTPFPVPGNSPLNETAAPQTDKGTRSDSLAPSKIPSVSVVDPQMKHTSRWIKYMIVAVGVSSVLAMSAVFIICFRANKVVTVRPWATGLSGHLQRAFVTGVPALKRSDLEAACEDFSNIVGSLSDSILYKGTLSSGVEVAVISSLISSAKDWTKQCESQFRKKIMSLSKVNHKNFMNLLGYCEEEQPFTRMMVFEYAPNGTLFEHLHVREADHLNWLARLRISMGIAYCLDHMHQLRPPVIPSNLNSSTIYLTDDYAAKVSDLQFWHDAKGTNTAGKNSGTLADPQSVVHKYGLLLLEIISGRVPSSEEGGLLESWASCYFNGERPPQDMVDPSLKSFSEETLTSLCGVIKSCINLDPKKRPTMAEVVARMREITLMPPDGATPKVSPLWWAELEIISSETN